MSNVTDEILRAWDDDEEQDSEAAADTEATDEVATEPAEDDEAGDEAEETEEDGEEQQEEDDDEDGGEETESEEEQEEPDPNAYMSDDPEVQAWLKRYQGDVEKALQGAAQLQRAMGRQGQEKAVLTRRVQELEREMAKAQAFQSGEVFLNEQQRAWVESAIDSGQPAAFVKAAVDAEEFSLARAVCQVWAQDDSYSAMRAASAVDMAEFQSQSSRVEEQPLETGTLLEILTEHYPDLPQYQEEMATLIEQMGGAHPLVEDARSRDPQVAARGIVGIYEIARARKTTLSSAREKVKQQRRQDADGAKQRAQVSSATAIPSPGETPRSRQIMPGLTLAQLDAEWDQ